jgi:hypothetical protein
LGWDEPGLLGSAGWARSGPGESGCWTEKKNIFLFSKNKISAVSSLLHRKISRADKFMKIFV